jgi:hypothetical protein
VLWIALDIALALLALTGLALVLLRLWRQTKALGGTIREASESVAAAQAAVPAVRRGAQDT